MDVRVLGNLEVEFDDGTLADLGAHAGERAAAGDAGAADRSLVKALGLWRGDAYAGLPSRLLDAEAARLGEMRLGAEAELWNLRVRSGRNAEAVPALEQLVRLHPFGERFWYLLALALYRTGRQRDAVDALRRARTTLAEELGIDPGPELRQLELSVLQQDPALLDHEGPSPAPPPAGRPIHTTLPVAGASTADDLVGRDAELATAIHALDRTLAGAGSVLVVTGEAGIGKTRFVTELLAVAADRGLRVGRGTWDPDPGPPLAGWHAAVAGALGTTDVLKPVGDEAVGDAASEIYRLADAMADRMRNTPTVLALDDVHWADSESLRLARRLIVLVPDLPVLVVIAARPPGPEAAVPLTELFGSLARQGAVRLDLVGLETGAVHDYVANRAGVEIPAGVAAELTARTGGNPFFLTEMVRALAAAGVLADGGTDAWAVVPPAVRDVVRHRLAGAPASAATVLGVAAVLGRSFEWALLRNPPLTESLADVDDLDEALESALVLGFLEADGPGRFRFVHPSS